MSDISERIKNLPPDKVDLLWKQLKPGAKPKSAAAVASKQAKRPFREERDQNFYLDVVTPGVLESLQFFQRPKYPLAADHLEVEVYAVGLNFRDVAVALGMYPKPPGADMPEFGCDGAGRVVAVAPGLTRFKPGDEIFFLSGECAFSRYVRVREVAAFHKPPQWSFEDAAVLALIFITVYFSLRVPGRLAAGERVLIQSAAGGIGLAAVQLAKKIGAEIFATAGTEEKRNYLRSLGIEHVLDSRSLDFAAQIMDITQGEGIDVVLNSLAGEAIERGLEILRADGRFIELGKRDLIPGRTLDLGSFTRSLLFSAVDTSYLFTYWPERLKTVLEEIQQHIQDGTILPMPTKVFRATEIIDAFRYMTSGNHIGRIAVTMRGEPILLGSR